MSSSCFSLPIQYSRQPITVSRFTGSSSAKPKKYFSSAGTFGSLTIAKNPCGTFSTYVLSSQKKACLSIFPANDIQYSSILLPWSVLNMIVRSVFDLIPGGVIVTY